MTRRSPAPKPKYPWQPLADLLADRGMESWSQLEDYLELDRRNLSALKRDGLTESAADKLATRCGLMPWLIWPEWLDNVIADYELECAADGCGVRFIPPPNSPRKRYCSRQCQNRSKMRAYRATPQGAQANRDAVARWRAECADYDKKRLARWKAANRDRMNARRRARRAELREENAA
jgi:hypothetical protein